MSTEAKPREMQTMGCTDSSKEEWQSSFQINVPLHVAPGACVGCAYDAQKARADRLAAEVDEWFAKWNRSMNSLSAAEKENKELKKLVVKSMNLLRLECDGRCAYPNQCRAKESLGTVRERFIKISGAALETYKKAVK